MDLKLAWKETVHKYGSKTGHSKRPYTTMDLKLAWKETVHKYGSKTNLERDSTQIRIRL
jgi:hypothetical protein